MDKVNSFISRFTGQGKYGQVIEAFTCGCCYWFADILAKRFSNDRSEIMYDQVMNHFGTQIDGRVYDSTGDVTNDFTWKPWKDMNDTSLVRRIERDCIMFER